MRVGGSFFRFAFRPNVSFCAAQSTGYLVTERLPVRWAVAGDQIRQNSSHVSPSTLKKTAVLVCEMIILCAVLLSLCGADAWKKNSRPLGQIEQVPLSPEVNMTTVNSFKFSYCNFFILFEVGIYLFKKQ
jgi:hypothetical protein